MSDDMMSLITLKIATGRPSPVIAKLLLRNHPSTAETRVPQLRDRLAHKIKTEKITGSSSMVSNVKLLKFRFKLLSLPSERRGKKRRLDLLTTANEREKGRVRNAGNALRDV